MQTTTQQGLTCYAISAAALMLLDPKTGGTLPDYWFNWQNGNTSRLTFIPDSWTQTDIVKWEQNTHGLGYNTALIVAEDEELAMLDLFDSMQPSASVSEDMGILLVTNYPADATNNTELLKTLQEPDFPLALAFSALRRGGGMDLSRRGYSDLSPFQWWTLACEFCRWAKLVCSEAHATNHPEMYALNRWDVYTHGGDFGVSDTKLKLAEYCDSTVGKSFKAFKDGLGSLDKPWSAETVGVDISTWSLQALPEVKADANGVMPKVMKVYPLRQAPICGVVVLDSGEILPYGGFASLIPEHQWVWDSGEVKAAIQKVNSLQKRN